VPEDSRPQIVLEEMVPRVAIPEDLAGKISEFEEGIAAIDAFTESWPDDMNASIAFLAEQYHVLDNAEVAHEQAREFFDGLEDAYASSIDEYILDCAQDWSDSVDVSQDVRDHFFDEFAVLRDNLIITAGFAHRGSVFAAQTQREFANYFAWRALLSGQRAQLPHVPMTDASQVFPRMFDSLYRVHLGPMTREHMELSEQDLDFLESFSYRGVRMFRKGVEKYRVGVLLREQGMAPEDIQAALEHATRFELEGRSYEWKWPAVRPCLE